MESKSAPSADDQLNSNEGVNNIKARNQNVESTATCDDVPSKCTNLTKTIICTTKPMTERVKFDWKIKNFVTLCPPNCSGFRPCCSNVFTVGSKVGVSCKWCFELRYDNGSLSMVLCRDKICVNATESLNQPSIPCQVSLMSPDGTVALEGVTGANPTQRHEDILTRIQAVVVKFGGFVHPRENSEWKQFISIQELHANRNRYFSQDGTIHFKMAFEILGVTKVKSAKEIALERCEALRKEAQERHRLQLEADLEALMKNGECSNLVIRCDNQVFSVHKQLVQTRCPKFYEKIVELSNTSKIRICKGTDPLLSKIVSLNDTDSETLSAFLEYVYTGTVKELSETFSKWGSLLELADRWDAAKLKDLCFYKMLMMLDAESTGPFICLANLHDASDDVWEFISAFCQINYDALIKNDTFNKSREDNPDIFQFFDNICAPM